MFIRIITLQYDDNLGGFSEGPLHKACAGRRLLDVSEYYFERGGVPHIAIIAKFADGPENAPRNLASRDDPMESLPVERRKLYLDLKRWRNERAEKDGVPPFVILRNQLLAKLCALAPHTKAALREIEGIGEKTVEKYGEEVLNLIPKELTEIPREDSA